MYWLSLIAFVSAASAQSLTIPSNWRKPTVTQTRAERIDIARSAIDLFNSYYDATAGRYNFSSAFAQDLALDDTFIDQDDTIEWARHGASGLRYTVMHDLIARTTVYENFTTGALLRAVDTNARTILGAPMDNLMTETFEQLGLAASVAYTAYGNPDMLALAKTIQGIIDEYISTNQGAGYPGAEAATQKCATTGLGGIIFPYLSGTPSPTSHLQEYGWIKSSDWSAYLALSSYVAFASGDNNVRNEATRMYEVLSSGAVPNLVRSNDSFAHHIYVYNASAAATSDVDSPLRTDADHTFANCQGYDAQSPSGGNLVQAYSAYGALTSSPSVNQRLIQAVESSTTYGNSEDGILLDFRPPYLIGRGGHLAGFVDPLTRSTNKDLHAYIQAYANVQFNALQDFAKNPTNGSYSQVWTEHDGDFGQFFDPYYQLEVIPALNLAIGRDEA
ncbi:hypothetical protein PENSPDRAFT_391988 [Peniophora sp. CONT]|nr:hypothetical protein PENSPDRAFT_391988 [Peniophora sp. CONT]